MGIFTCTISILLLGTYVAAQQCDPDARPTTCTGNNVCRETVVGCKPRDCVYKCLSGIKLGETCHRTATCRVSSLPRGTFCDRVVCGCISRVCSCVNDYVAIDGDCAYVDNSGGNLELGDPCNKNNCVTKKSVCNSATHTCTCDSGYIQSSKKCNKLKKLGQNCKKTSVCYNTALGPGENCDRSNGCGCYKKKCACTNGWKRNGQKCKKTNGASTDERYDEYGNEYEYYDYPEDT